MKDNNTKKNIIKVDIITHEFEIEERKITQSYSPNNNEIIIKKNYNDSFIYFGFSNIKSFKIFFSNRKKIIKKQKTENLVNNGNNKKIDCIVVDHSTILFKI